MVEAAVARRLAALKEEVGRDPQAVSRRSQAARERAGRETLERAEKARAALARLRAEKAKRRTTHPQDEARKKAEPEASLTDPDARRMRFADGAVRAAYNVQVAAAPGAGVIVAVMTTDRRNDAGLALPMVEAIAGRYGRAPNQLLVDTVYATCADIAALARREGDPVMVCLCAAAARAGRHQAGEPEQPSLQALARARAGESLARTHGERRGPERVQAPQAHRAGACSNQAARLWSDRRAGSDQGAGRGALARAGPQPPRRSPFAAGRSLRSRQRRVARPLKQPPSSPAAQVTRCTNDALRRKAYSFTGSEAGVVGGSEFMAEFEEACAAKNLALFVLPPKRPDLNGAVEPAQSSWRYEFYACHDLPSRLDRLNQHIDAFAHLYNPTDLTEPLAE